MTIDAARNAANARQRGSWRRSGSQREASPAITGRTASPIASAEPASRPRCHRRPCQFGRDRRPFVRVRAEHRVEHDHGADDEDRRPDVVDDAPARTEAPALRPGDPEHGRGERQSRTGARELAADGDRDEERRRSLRSSSDGRRRRAHAPRRRRRGRRSDRPAPRAAAAARRRTPTCRACRRLRCRRPGPRRAGVQAGTPAPQRSPSRSCSHT